MSDRDAVGADRHMDLVLHHVTQGTRLRVTQGRESADRSPVQLPTRAHRGIRRPRGYGVTKRGRIQANGGDDRVPGRISQRHLLGRHVGEHLELVGEGGPTEEIAGGLCAGRQQVRLPDQRDCAGRVGGGRRG